MACSGCIDGLLVKASFLREREKAEKLTVVIRVPAYEAEVGNSISSNSYILPLKFPVPLSPYPHSFTQQTLWKVVFAIFLSPV
ncbi:hypothetical protein CEXT_367071 [Caerostris extrusa]|uniref:Uncharacterized protein n=1 Tax=Caerostris extrusa TaxID=172846 RepID=A0AAV4NH96_CAEEX|nr:hypothetical protein CEXT_367071 [Caerostris extrusa]